ncbi:MAG: phosphoadenylyl-sulfate reductase [Desulfuromonas sp.]|nr:MAG: phosphoadenylyl-sulfate reductase [Desulfuromonas sp.]
MQVAATAETTRCIKSAVDILTRGIDRAGGPVNLACSFSLEDTVIIDLAQSHGLPVGIFAIDTGRLPEETYQMAELVRERYGVEIDWYFPQATAVQRLERENGLFSFRNNLESRKQCCAIRKVEPLQRALRGLAGWVTGMRREQSVTRSELVSIEPDREHPGLLKIHPLYGWSEEELWAYANEFRIPVHPLHRKNYPSIGCAPCTRAVEPGEDIRAGRWWWENSEHKECGLHRS